MFWLRELMPALIFGKVTTEQVSGKESLLPHWEGGLTILF